MAPYLADETNQLPTNVSEWINSKRLVKRQVAELSLEWDAINIKF